jgi:competence protein ComEC
MSRFIVRAFRLAAIAWALVAAVALAPAAAVAAPSVQPSQRVTRWVNVRQGPETGSDVIGRILPGETAELIAVGPAWYQVRLADGRTGYVSRGWVVRIEDAAEAGAGAVYRIHLIDVGTGLSVFVDGPGFALLYDAGSNDDKALGTGNRVLSYIRHARPDLTTLDHVILSHPHEDHVALLPEIVMAYQVRNVWDSGRDYKNCQYHAFLRVVRDKRIPYHDADALTGPHVAHVPPAVCSGRHQPAEDIVVAHAAHIAIGTPIPLGPGAHMTFLHADSSPDVQNANENSLVMALDVGRSRVLFMGDAQAGERADPSVLPDPRWSEGKLLDCCAAQLRSDVLVAGHHGSETSSRTKTLDAIGAYVFLVSSGPFKYSGRQLPDREVIDEFKRRGTVYRTDADDAACRSAAAKIGPDNDNKPGGCDNVVVTIDAAGHIRAAYDRSSD